MDRDNGLKMAPLLLVFAALAPVRQVAHGQQPATQANAAVADSAHANTAQGRLARVDVVVQGKDGKALRGLKPENFRLTVDKIPQVVDQALEHSALMPNEKVLELPTMPPGTFTDYTPLAPDGTLNILLLDALNTPVKKKAFFRNALKEYVQEAKPGTHIEILGLANHLILLQGFTSNPETLKSIVDHKLIPRSTSLLTHSDASDADRQNVEDVVNANAPSMAHLAANLEEFEVQMGAMETQLRGHFTLDALDALGRYLSAFPGRKNLIWVSGSFPIRGLVAGSAKRSNDPADEMDTDELRETAQLLSAAHVAIYPINAGNLVAASDVAKPVTGHPGKYGDELKKIGTSAKAEHANMEQLAAETGGKAFYDVSRLADAVGEAIDAGKNYYSVAYRPSHPGKDGTMHEIRVSVTGNDAGRGAQLAYWHEMYAGGEAQGVGANEAVGGAATDPGKASAGIRAAMSRGAPAPQNLLFKVRVLPASAATESAVAPDNTLDGTVSPKGPFRRYDVDYVALAKEMTLGAMADGRRSGKVEFLVYVFDVDGRLLNGTGKTLSVTLTPANYTRYIRSVLEGHIEVSVPSEQQTFLRIGVRDLLSDKFGVVEIPTADVSHLAPAVYPATPPAGEAVPMGQPAAKGASTMPSTSPPAAAVP